MLSQPDPVCSAAQCIQLPDESCHYDDHTAGGGVSFSQPTHLDNLLVCTQLMATPGTSQVRWLLMKLIWCFGFARNSIKDGFYYVRKRLWHGNTMAVYPTCNMDQCCVAILNLLFPLLGFCC